MRGISTKEGVVGEETGGPGIEAEIFFRPPAGRSATMSLLFYLLRVVEAGAVKVWTREEKAAKEEVYEHPAPHEGP